jgi:hypothetical protein
MNKINNKVEEIKVSQNTESKVEEIVIPKSKKNIEPYSDDEEKYLKYLIHRYIIN